MKGTQDFTIYLFKSFFYKCTYETDSGKKKVCGESSFSRWVSVTVRSGVATTRAKPDGEPAPDHSY